MKSCVSNSKNQFRNNRKTVSFRGVSLGISLGSMLTPLSGIESQETLREGNATTDGNMGCEQATFVVYQDITLYTWYSFIFSLSEARISVILRERQRRVSCNGRETKGPLFDIKWCEIPSDNEGSVFFPFYHVDKLIRLVESCCSLTHLSTLLLFDK